MLIDVHAHIDSKEFEKDREEVLNRCTILVVNAGVDLESNLRSLELEKKYKNVIAAVGFHPEFVKDKINEVEKCLELTKKARIISEIGLDYYWIKEDEFRKKEIEILLKFFEVAERERKPVILHVRGGFTDLLQLIQSFKIKFAIHGFEGNVKNAIKVVDLGGFISVPPILLRDKNRQDIVRHIDLEYLLTETDSPFMGAEKLARNEPCNVRLTIQKIAELKRTSNCEVEKKIENNFKRLISGVPLQ